VKEEVRRRGGGEGEMDETIIKEREKKKGGGKERVNLFCSRITSVEGDGR
jgi:hypothetical protein